MRWLTVTAALFTAMFVSTLAIPSAALGIDSSDVYGSFTEYELGRLLVETDDFEDCEFVMHDYEEDTDVYLTVRHAYQSRYEELVGDDSVSLMSAGRGETVGSSDDPINVPLVELTGVDEEPWCDVLNLDALFTPVASRQGSAFMVSGTTAVTAAHCVYDGGAFTHTIRAQSAHVEGGFSMPFRSVSKAIVQKNWIDSAGSGTADWQKDFEHDFAILVFDDAPRGTSGSQFALDSITIADSLAMSVNNAGYAYRDGYTGVHAWTCESYGGISPIDVFFPGGNAFQVGLEQIQGMSGGPVYRYGDGGYHAVGVISHNVGVLHYACRITERLQVLGCWAAEGGCGHVGPDQQISPFTGPSGGDAATGLQAAAQRRLQGTAPGDIPAALGRAMAANPDVWGWLYVPGTSVSVPVARREGDGDYYLAHDSLGNASPIGCAFAHAGAGDPGGPVTVLYGHSFASGDLAFTSLHAFEDYGFFSGHGEAYLYLPGRVLEYRVVAANPFNARAIEEVDQSDAVDLADYFDELSSPDPSRFLGLKRDVRLDPARDRVLQLSTCTVPADPARRFVVTCALVGEEEL